jgi:Domain of unknown function (DUF1707)
MYGYYGYDQDEHDQAAASDPSVRAADADREATADRLRQHHAEGRIDVTEFQERLDGTYQAKTVGELRKLVSDLPRDPQPGLVGRGPRLQPMTKMPWVPLLFLAIAISALAGHHHHHAGLWVLIPLVLLARFLAWGHRPRGYGLWGRRRQAGTDA